MEGNIENTELETLNEIPELDNPEEKGNVTQPGKAQKLPYKWLEIAEIVSLVGGSLGAIITQQVIFATLPLSVAMALNVVNRRQLLEQIGQNSQNLHLVAAQVDENSQQTHVLLQEIQTQVGGLQQNTQTLGKGSEEIRNYAQNLNQAHAQTLKLVNCLRDIEMLTQTIRLNPENGEAYYNRGQLYQRLGDKEAAIADLTAAIRSNPHAPHFYQNRGSLRAASGHRQGAVDDLRLAAKLFFEQGDIPNYQQAKDMSKNIHEVMAAQEDNGELDVAVENLLAS